MDKKSVCKDQLKPSDEESCGSEDEAQLISQPASGNTRWIVIAGVAGAVCLVFVIGMSVGLTRGACDGSNDRWCQPASPRRAFVFTRFTSCAQVKEALNADRRGGGAIGNDAQMSADFDSYDFLPWYPSDYCDYCNCTTNNDNMWMMKDLVLMDSAPDAAKVSAASEGATAAARDFTGTNNQVQGVDEADVIKTDGKYLYILPRSGDVLVVSQVFPASAAQVLARVNLTRYNLRATDALLDTNSNVLAILGTSAITNTAGTVRLSMTAIHLWDIANKRAPALTSVYEIEGSAVTARFLGGFVYAVVNTWPSYMYSLPRRQAGSAAAASADQSSAPQASQKERAQHPPRRLFSGGGTPAPPPPRSLLPLKRALTAAEADVEARPRVMVAVAPVCECEALSYVANLRSAASGWVTVVAVSTSAPTLGQVKTATHAGRADAVMASDKNLYISATNWDYSMAPDGRPDDGQWTVVLQFALARGNPSFERLLTVPGTVINQFAMDEFKDHFRVATTYGQMWGDPPTSKSNVYIYEANRRNGEYTSTPVGAIEGLAPGERIYSVRYAEEMAYVVTFRQVDPLFVLDLSDASKPLVKGQLKIPGFSEYLHPVSGSLILGLGKNTKERPDGRVLMGGVKLSLFDVSVPETPIELDQTSVGTTGSTNTDTKGSYSIAATDHKAFLFHAASGLLVVPMHVRRPAAPATPHQGNTSAWQPPPSAGETERWAFADEVAFDGAYVYYVKDKKISLHTRVSHYYKPLMNAWSYGYNEPRQIYRAVYMDGLLLTVSDRLLRIDHLQSKATQVLLNVTFPDCTAGLYSGWLWYTGGFLSRPMAMP